MRLLVSVSMYFPTSSTFISLIYFRHILFVETFLLPKVFNKMKIQPNQNGKWLREVFPLAIKSSIFPLRNSDCLNHRRGRRGCQVIHIKFIDTFSAQSFFINYKVLGHKLNTSYSLRLYTVVQIKAPYFVKRAFRALRSPHTPSPSVSLTQLSMAPEARMKSLLTEWFSSWTQSITSQCS